MLEIDLKSREPIYKQIYSNIEQLVLKGVLKPDEQLWSVRQLAKTMGINPNTITKAYWELEKNGVIYSVAGRGCFVSPDLGLVSLLKKKEILAKLKTQLDEAKNLGIDEPCVQSLVLEVYKTNQEEETL